MTSTHAGVMIDPTEVEVSAALASAAEAADRGQRSRTVSNVIGTFQFKGDCGVFEYGGWGVPNSYQSAATTSVAGVSWFTDLAGRRHVRVKASRVKAPKSSLGRLAAEAFPGTFDDSPLSEFVSAVYSDTRTPETLLKKHENGRKAERWPALKVSLYKAIEAEPLEPSHRAALADWYGEQGREHEAESCRRAFETVASL